MYNPIYPMKIRLQFLSLLFVASSLWADVHISISTPETLSAQELAQYVGQTVIFDSPMVVCGNANGNYVVSPWRRFEPLCQGVVGSESYNTTVRINNHCMFNLSNVINYHRCGEKIYTLRANVSSTNNLTFLDGNWSGNTRTELESGIPDLGDYRLLICGFNLENYFMTLGSMGAQTDAKRQIQRQKVSKALKRINADIYGLVELQQGDEAIAEIVADLNKNLPERNYQYFHDAASGTFQKVDYVYDANTVAPISHSPAETNVEVQNRKKMMCFTEISTGEKFIYSINHFKAMNTGDEGRRVNEAKAVIKLYNSYRQASSVRDKDILIMGDLNCYAFTEPIKVFTDNGFIDMHRAFHADSSYSYMFGGMASYIDHAIANGTMYRQVTGMAGYHINSDEDDYYTYDKSGNSSMFRCSDHDPVLVGLKLDSTLLYDPTPQINSMEIIRGESEKLTIYNAHQEGKESYYAIYTTSGVLKEQKEITSVSFEVTLPREAGIYIVYIYYDGQVYQRKMIVR